MTERERTMLEYMRAIIAGDGHATVEAAKTMHEMAPSPITSFQIVIHAVLTNHPRTATEMFESSLEYGSWPPNWYFETTARHMLGEHRLELEEARRGNERFPNNAFLMLMEAKALAALGELDQLYDLMEEAVGIGAGPNLMVRIAEDLDVHGYHEASLDMDDLIQDWYDLHLDEALGTVRGRTWWAVTLTRFGRLEEARRIILRLHDERPDHIGFRGYLGVIAARMGDRETADAISSELAELRDPYLLGNNFAWRARIAAVLGEHELAVALLTSGFGEGLQHHPSDWRGGFGDTFGEWHCVWLHAEPEFASLRDYPPFQELIRPKG
jgi:tetratricopeptide (TPR) repeat protein